MSNVIIYDTYNVNVTIENDEVVGVQVVAGFIHDVIAGTNISIDKTDPLNPVISSSGGGSMTYPGAGIPLSTGSAWDTSITNNSSNWNTAFGWGNHASAGYITLSGTQALTGNKIVTGSGSNYNLALGDASLGELGAFTVVTAGATSISSTASNTSSLSVGGNIGSLRNGPRGYEASPTGIFIFANAGQYIEGDVTGFKFVLGSDASQDLYKRDPSGYLVRIPLGSSGDVLTNVSGTVGWAAPSGGGGALSAITAATGSNTINNAANAQEWQWNTLAAGTGLLLSSSSTAAASNTNTLFRVNQAGANATSTQTTYSGYFSNTKTGTSSTNVGLYSEASGGTTNLAVKTGTGSVLIGNALSDAITANTRLDVRGTGTSTEFIQRWASSTNNAVLSVTNQGQITLSPSGGVAGLSWGGQVQIGSTSNGTSFTNNGTGILVYGSVSTTSNNVFTVLNNASLTATSGTQNSIMANVGFAPTSGTAAFNGYRLTSTINQTGGANGTVSMIALTPTYTAAGGDVYGFRYAPTVTSITGVHYSFSATSGLMALNASVAGSSSFRIPHGTAPSSPVDGDIWTTTAGLYVRINGATVGPLT